jgi:aminoglycoside N3'-acetyltransferase
MSLRNLKIVQDSWGETTPAIVKCLQRRFLPVLVAALGITVKLPIDYAVQRACYRAVRHSAPTKTGVGGIREGMRTTRAVRSIDGRR